MSCSWTGERWPAVATPPVKLPRTKGEPSRGQRSTPNSRWLCNHCHSFGIPLCKTRQLSDVGRWVATSLVYRTGFCTVGQLLPCGVSWRWVVELQAGRVLAGTYLCLHGTFSDLFQSPYVRGELCPTQSRDYSAGCSMSLETRCLTLKNPQFWAKP